MSIHPAISKDANTPSGSNADYVVSKRGGAIRIHPTVPKDAQQASVAAHQDAALTVSIAAFPIRPYASFQAFAEHVESFALRARQANSRVLLLPELVSMGLLWTDARAAAIDNAQVGRYYRQVLTPLLPAYIDLMVSFAKTHDLTIVGASFWHEEAGHGRNSAFVFSPDGAVLRQDKLHMTRGERAIDTRAGEQLTPFSIDGIRCGMLVCYDAQFPELTQHLCQQDVEILFLPILTEPRGYWRQWHSCHARALENQLYVCVSPLVGELGVPTDHPVRASGKAFVACPIDNRMDVADGTYAVANEDEELLHVTLDMARLRLSRARGEVRQLKDRRPDLYRRLIGEGDKHNARDEP